MDFEKTIRNWLAVAKLSARIHKAALLYSLLCLRNSFFSILVSVLNLISCSMKLTVLEFIRIQIEHNLHHLHILWFHFEQNDRYLHRTGSNKWMLLCDSFFSSCFCLLLLLHLLYKVDWDCIYLREAMQRSRRDG